MLIQHSLFFFFKEKPSYCNKLLSVNNIEVIYDHVILVLKGTSLEVPKGGIVALLGANGAGKTTTLKAISNLLHAERGEVTKGSIEFDGTKVHDLGDSEQTILHEILHTLKVPPKCGTNIDLKDSLHVTDNKDDIMNKVSGSLYLDFNNDDYYKHNILNCPDLYKNKFLTNLKN